MFELTNMCDPATFGRNQEDVLDESYRKAGKLDSTDFATFFDPVRSGLIEIIRGCLLEGQFMPSSTSSMSTVLPSL